MLQKNRQDGAVLFEPAGQQGAVAGRKVVCRLEPRGRVGLHGCDILFGQWVRQRIEDTRQALIEAKRDGTHSFCTTIDTEARDYLPHMYGAVNYTVIDEVRKLPLKVPDIYRRLTT